MRRNGSWRSTISRVEVWIPWPIHPLVTKTGKVSMARGAGRGIPWMGANVVNRMPRPVYVNVHNKWREAAKEAAQGLVWTGDTPCLLELILYKRTAKDMDSLAVVEGAKSCVDGLVDAGVWPDDNDAYVRGALAVARKAPSDELGLYIHIRSLSEFLGTNTGDKGATGKECPESGEYAKHPAIGDEEVADSHGNRNG